MKKLNIKKKEAGIDGANGTAATDAGMDQDES